MTVTTAIDVGSNATRLVLARLRRDGSLKVLARHREPIRLGSEVFAEGSISDVTLSRLAATLKRFAAVCRSVGSAPLAVGTAALREAVNREQAVAAARAAGVELAVVSGEEEARLTCLAVVEGTAPAHRALCIDAGGGSTEIVVTRGELPEERWSLPLGSARLAAQHGTGVAALGAAVEAALAGGLPARRDLPGWARGSSGMLRALVRFAAPEGRAGRRELQALAGEVVALGAAGRARAFGAERAESAVAGAVLLSALARRLDLEGMTVTRRGVAEGVALERLRGGDAELPSLRRATV